MFKKKKSYNKYKYKWEFLRRNEEYINAYDEFIKTDQLPDRLKKIAIKYRINYFFDPNKSYDDYNSKDGNPLEFVFRSSDQTVYYHPLRLINKKKLLDLLIWMKGVKPIPVRQLINYNEGIMLLVDLSKPKKEILEEIQNILYYSKKEYKVKHKDYKLRYDIYDEYLKIYDLKKRLSYSKIAQKLYKRQLENPDYDEESLLKKLKRNYKESKKIIKSGGTQIV